MLKANEELWAKELPKAVEELLSKERETSEVRTQDYGKKYDILPRDKTRVVTYRAPHNSAVQIYDYKAKRARVVFGPELIMLGPDEDFTVLSLSGDVPKRPNVIKTLALLLGPDFMTDIVTVETADHARLSLKLAYNWEFNVNKEDQEDAASIFSVPDFIGDACKAVASRVRGAVAAQSFDNFHKDSANIIRAALFGGEEGEARKFSFSSNNFYITNIDIQSVEPVDQRTRDSLQKSVQLAIEITTKSLEASARHEAEKNEQEARGRLERQKLTDEADAEKARKDLLALQAQSQVVEETGAATAAAKAKAEAAKIEGEMAVKQAELKAQAHKIRAEVEIETLTKQQEKELAYQRRIYRLEIDKKKELANIENDKLKAIVSAIGAETIESIALAGPQMQAKLLGALGVKSILITDNSSPINLISNGSGLLGLPQSN
jgi:major vault protein